MDVKKDSVESFHLKLFQLLKERVKERITPDDSYAEVNLNLRAFLEELSHQEKRDSFSRFDEVLKSFHMLMKEPLVKRNISEERFGEQEFLRALNPRDFAALKMRRYYPRLYRGFPREYERENVYNSRIKKPFFLRDVMRDLAIEKAVYSLYGNVTLSGKVLVIFAIEEAFLPLEIARFLKTRLDGVEVRCLGVGSKEKIASFPPLENGWLLPQDLEEQSRPKGLKEYLSSCDLLIHFPSDKSDGGRAFLEAFPHPRFTLEEVGGYGLLEEGLSEEKHLFLGLHSLEKGLLTRRPIEAKWEDIQNGDILRWKAGKKRLYLADLKTKKGAALYLSVLLHAEEKKPPDIDLCTFHLDWLFSLIEEEGFAFFSKRKVRSIEILFQGYIFLQKIASSGRVLRILCPSKLSLNDFRSLLFLSEDFVALSEDFFFSEAISQQKPFFYDGEKKSLIKDLLAFAQSCAKNLPKALSFIRKIEEGYALIQEKREKPWVDEDFFKEMPSLEEISTDLSSLIIDGKFSEQFGMFCRLLVDEMSANVFLAQLVQRGLFHQRYPEIKRFEKQIRSRFARKEISFLEMIEDLQKALLEKS